MATITAHHFDLKIHWYTGEGSPIGDGSILATEGSLYFRVDTAQGAVYKYKNGAWEEIGSGISSGSKVLHGVESWSGLSFDAGTQIVTITDVIYWYKGIQFVSSGNITCDINSFETLTTNTLYKFYFDDTTGTLKCTDGSWDFKENVFFCTVYWNGSAGAIQKEMHNHTRDLDWHIWAHDTIGTRYESGSVLTYPTTAVDNQLSITDGVYHDEDQDHSTGICTTMRGWHLVPGGKFTFEDYSLPYLGTSGQPQYLDTDTNLLTNVGATDFVNVWVYASLDIDRSIYMVPTHAATAFNTIIGARAETTPTTVGMNNEMKLIYKFIYKGDGEFQEMVDYRSSSPVPGGGTLQILASNVIFTPTGTISSTNVQNAIQEVADERVPYTGATGNVDLGNNQLILHKTGSTGLMKHTTTTGLISYITDNSANWNTAYSWGNHSVQGYAYSYQIPNIPTSTQKHTIGVATFVSDQNWTTIVFDTPEWDDGGEYNTTGGTFTAASDGYFDFKARVQMEPLSVEQIAAMQLNLAGVLKIAFFKNNNLYSVGTYHPILDTNNGLDIHLKTESFVLHTDKMLLIAGDIIEVKIWHNTGYNWNTTTDITQNFFTSHQYRF